ncbi:SDR family NAD(P)-dependent oxidoreductase, partial [Streptomyces sp. L500]
AALARVDVVQPALWAVMVSLAELWRSWGVPVSAVIGHSQGEIAAATVAGALSPDDAARVVALRSRLIAEKLSGLGGMVSIALPRDQVVAMLPEHPGVSVAAVNGSSSTVVSGDTDGLNGLLTTCEKQGIRARRIDVDYASHSPQVELIHDELLAALAGISPRTSDIPFVSTVTGERIDTAELGPEYWYRNLRQTVEFQAGVRFLLDQGHTTFLESSPHPVLAVGIEETADRAVVLESLRRDDADLTRMVSAAAEAWTRGVAVDWPRLLDGGRRIDLPTYAFERRRYWLEAPDRPRNPADHGDQDFWSAVEQGDLDRLAGMLQGRAAVETDLRPPLKDVLPALSGWHRERQLKSAVDSWRYRVRWRPVADPRTPAALDGRWTVVVPAEAAHDDMTDRICSALRDHGADVDRLVLAPGETRTALTERLRATRPAGIVSLLGLTTAAHPDHDVVPGAVADTVLLVQALTDAAVRAPLWTLTRDETGDPGADPVTSTASAQLWALARVAGLEHPELWGGLLDLPAELDERAATLLAAVLAAPEGEDQLALRPAGLLARRLVRAPLPDDAPAPAWRPRDTALVTGGTGGLGGHVARWLAGAGIRHLVLVSRRGPDAEGAGRLRDELAAMGVQVTLAACDVADRDALAALLERVRAAGPPIRTVVHTAGSGRGARLLDTDTAEIAAVLAPKAAGARNLHELLGDLDAFILFSSGAGVWGSGGQGAYAAANAHLDALTEERRRRGQAATSVAWGAWDGDGMAAGPAEEWLHKQGLRFMRPDTAIDALHHALDRDERTLVVADIDWRTFAPRYTAARPRPLLDEIPEARPAPAPDAPDDVPDLVARLATLSGDERRRALLADVRAQAALVLGHPGADAVPADRPFRDLGYDSLTAVRLRNRLAAATGLSLPATLVFDHPTAAALATYLGTRLAPDANPARTSLLEDLTRLEATVAALSPDSLPVVLPDPAEQAALTVRLKSLLAKWDQAQGGERSTTREQIDDVADDDLFDFIDAKFGRS